MASSEGVDRPAGRSPLRPARSPWRRRLENLVSIDERSLTLFRISLALVLLADLALRARFVTAHYTDSGAIPQSLLEGVSSPSSSLFFLYGLHGSTGWAALLLAVTAIAAIALLVGYRARWAAAACCLLVFSLHARAPSLTHGGDDLLRILLVWAALLPLGSGLASGGVRTHAGSSPRLRTVATVAVLIQLTAFLWLAPPAGNGSTNQILASNAFSDALQLDVLVTSWGVTLGGWPDLARFADLTGRALILIAPFLLWSPFLTGPLRAIAALCIVQFELLAVGPAFLIGIQPWVTAAAWTLFVPTWIWDQVTETVRSGGDRQTGSATRRGVVGLLSLVVLVAGFIDVSPGESERNEPSGAIRSLATQVGLATPRAFLLPAATHLTDGWLVARGTTARGTAADPWHMSEPSFDRPTDIGASFKSIRWRDHVMRAISASDAAARFALIDYLCRRWNQGEPSSPMSRIELVFMLQREPRAEQTSPALPVAVAASDCRPVPEQAGD